MFWLCGLWRREIDGGADLYFRECLTTPLRTLPYGRANGNPRDPSGFTMIRRRFVFWLGMGLFSLAEKLRADGLDDLAAAVMRGSETKPPRTPGATPEHWTLAGNNTWRWFERENFVGERWKVTGITTPIHKRTGEPYTGRSGYLDESLVPAEVRFVDANAHADAGDVDVEIDASDEQDPGHPNGARRARHGRPPSKWLRSLHAAELRIWLKTIDVPEAGVSGMTFWEHLTRDHSFDPSRIAGLTLDEQAKLHAAAHYGY